MIVGVIICHSVGFCWENFIINNETVLFSFSDTYLLESNH